MKQDTIKIILYTANIFGGIGSALIWVAQGEYTSLCATEETKGFYMGHFWAIYMGA